MACNDKRDEGPDYTRNDKGDKIKKSRRCGIGYSLKYLARWASETLRILSNNSLAALVSVG